MPKIRDWLQKNGDKAKRNMLLNDRYIFHKIVNADGPIGAMGLPLVAGRSMAVDKSYIPLGTMMWLETSGPDGEALNRVVMAEDVGSAIKGHSRRLFLGAWRRCIKICRADEFKGSLFYSIA